ncbi:DNA primase [Pseudofulvimonas gallinarii]|uniref:DNA primase n=1 Tax=Pseudofulvimonas gallinarii TaxID=634155 RepID=A0A4S3KXI9_9GAMM|nr:DNA primase [Pseudofulvimonas gallinarii]TCS99236.1 DNA primase [Pseudofulvimonas gallinarii]THD13960.1 DNA primase [Pseudofulvimonas gallinarii]
MAGRIPSTFIDELLSRIDIVEVIEARVPLKKAGRDHQACCPFHDERTPSFTVSPTKQFYHCFGCGAHGSAIKFLMEYDRLEFVDAVEELARRAGLSVPYEGGTQQRTDHSDDYALLAAATGWFESQLRASTVAQAYFEQRGVSAELRERFRLGYAPEGWDGLKRAIGDNEARVRGLLRHGLLIEGGRSGSYDRFRDRVMFPIMDRRGRPIAFGGRVLGGDDGPKYMNSPETPLFHKGRELFGLWQARQAQGKLARLLVVEGYMDVIALHQHGLEQAVATLGTATTREHAELLFRNAPDVYFCFDGDRAGRQAAWRAVESVLPRMTDGRQAWFVFLPDGEDPDSLVRKEGAAGFEQRLAQATPLSSFFFSELGQDVQLGSLDGKARLAERARPLLAQLPDGVFRDLMLEALTELTGSTRAPPPVNPGTTRAATRRRTPSTRRSLVREAIALLLQRPVLAAGITGPVTFGDLDRPGVPLLVELLERCRARPETTTAMLLEHFAERPELDALQRLAVAEPPGDPATWEAVFNHAIARLGVMHEDQRLAQLQALLAAGQLDAAGKDELRGLHLRKAQRRLQDIPGH